MKFQLWLEGRFEKETTDLSRIIIRFLKDNLSEFKTNNALFVFYGNLSKLEQTTANWIKKEGKIHKVIDNSQNLGILASINKDNKISTRGTYGQNLIKVTITLPTSTSAMLGNFNYLITSLKTTIRHELEHSSQSKEVLQRSAQVGTNPSKNYLAYFTNEGEVAAFVSSLYKAAKMKKTPFSKELENFLSHLKKIMPEKDIDVVREKFVAYQQKRFPRAF